MRNSWWILFINYPSTATSILATVPYKKWTCTKICLRQSNASDSDKCCRWLLKADYSVPCIYSTSTALWVTCTVLILYAFVLLFLLFMALKRKRREALAPRKFKDLSLGDDFLKSIQFLGSNYKDRFWYWEMIEIGRKIVLTVGMVFFGKQSHSGIALATLLACSICSYSIPQKHAVQKSFYRKSSVSHGLSSLLLSSSIIFLQRDLKNGISHRKIIVVRTFWFASVLATSKTNRYLQIFKTFPLIDS